MAARPSWEGHLRLSLVTCPVGLWPAASETETVRFNLINPKTGNRIRMKTVDAVTGEDLKREDLVKGFALSKTDYIILTKEDFEGVKLESTKVIDIEKFVPASSIERVYWDTPYHLTPSGKTGVEAFAVIRAAMIKKEMVAIGRLVMTTRERICAIEPHGDGLLLTTLRTAEEVRDETLIMQPDLPKPSPAMVEIAEKLVDQHATDFDPSRFHDRYEEALRAMVEKKKKGKPVTRSKPANDDNGGVDLMEALRRSIAGEGPSIKKPGARKTRKAA